MGIVYEQDGKLVKCDCKNCIHKNSELKATPVNSPPRVKTSRGLKPCVVCSKEFYALNDKENYCGGVCVRKERENSLGVASENVNGTEAGQMVAKPAPSSVDNGDLF